MSIFSRLLGGKEREAPEPTRLEVAELTQRVANVELAMAETQDKVYRWMKRHQEREKPTNGGELAQDFQKRFGTDPRDVLTDRVEKLLARRARGA